MLSALSLMSTVVYCRLFSSTSATDIYTLSLHDALPISRRLPRQRASRRVRPVSALVRRTRSSEAGEIRTGSGELAERGLARLLLAALARSLGLVASAPEVAAAERFWLAGRARAPFLSRM